MSPKSLFPVLLILLSLSYCAFSECTLCYDNNSTSKFLCNGLNCSSFVWPSPYLPQDIQCKEIYPQKQCYTGKYNGSSMFNYTYYFTACNQSMDYCAQCTLNTSCSKCYRGTVLYRQGCARCSQLITGCTYCDNEYYCTECAFKYTLVQNYTSGDLKMNCLSCSKAIPGCIDCSSRSSCTICDLKYMPINGLCYQKDGKTLAGTLDYPKYTLDHQREAANQQTQMNDLLTKIFASLIALCALIFIGIMVLCRVGSKLSKDMQKRNRGLLNQA